MAESIGYFLLFVIVVVIIWLIIREFICWYYKINERLSEQRKTNWLLEELLNKISNGQSGNLNAIQEFSGSDVVGEYDPSNPGQGNDSSDPILDLK